MEWSALFLMRGDFLISAGVFLVGVGCYRIRRSVAVVSTRGSTLRRSPVDVVADEEVYVAVGTRLGCI